jgi:hypothetical protein
MTARTKNPASVSLCAPFSPDHAGPRPPGPSGAERAAPARVRTWAAARGSAESAPAPSRSPWPDLAVAVAAGVVRALPVPREGAASSPAASAPTSAASPIVGRTSYRRGTARSRRPLSWPAFSQATAASHRAWPRATGLAILRYGACAAPAVEPTPRLAGHRPLPAKAVTVAHAGAAALFVFPMRAGLCHRRDLSMQMAFLIVHLGA